MNILILQVFISLILVAGAVVLFVHTVRARTLEHADRLALAPLEDDQPDTAGTAGDKTDATSGGSTGSQRPSATKGELP